MTLTQTLKSTPVKELLRAVNSTKAYLYFDISVFNVGASIHVKCTDTFKQINPNTWNGYNFIIENDSTTKYYIAETLKAFKTEDITKFKTPSQLKRANVAIEYYS